MIGLKVNFSTNEKQNKNQSQLQVVHAFFPALWILICWSRCLFLFWLVGVITLLLVFRQSFALIPHSVSPVNLIYSRLNQQQYVASLFLIGRVITHHYLEPIRKPTKTKAIVWVSLNCIAFTDEAVPLNVMCGPSQLGESRQRMDQWKRTWAECWRENRTEPMSLPSNAASFKLVKCVWDDTELFAKCACVLLGTSSCSK